MASHFARWTLDPTLTSEQPLPESIINIARNLPEKRRVRYLASRTLLSGLMQRVYGLSTLPELSFRSNGRPCFADPGLPDFSIAYAGNIVGVLLADEESLAGLGMEIVRAHSRQTMAQFARGLSTGEKAWINAQTDINEAATQLWAIRQSVLKLSDKDDQDSNTLRLLPASGRLRSQAFPESDAVSDVEDLLVWSCAFSRRNERLYLWDYNGTAWQKGYDLQTTFQHAGPRVLRLKSLRSDKGPEGQ